MLRVLFVCTGNTCRSPLAEGILSAMARERGMEVEAKSAGLAAFEGIPVSEYSAAILQEKGISTDGMRSRRVNRELVDWADLVLTMTMGHKQMLIANFPDALDKIHTLVEYAHSGDGRVNELAAERERLAAELEIKRSTGGKITPEDTARLRELEMRLPDPDIADPIGGSVETYRKTAGQIGEAIGKVLDRLAAEAGSGDGSRAEG